MISDRAMLTVKMDAHGSIGKLLFAWYNWGIPVYLQTQWLISIFGPQKCALALHTSEYDLIIRRMKNLSFVHVNDE